MNKERSQADKLYSKGEGHLKPFISLFRNVVSAVNYFDEAFKLYKKIGASEECLKTLEECIKCNTQLKDFWAVARNHENILKIYLEKQNQLGITDQTLIKQTQTCFNSFRQAQSTDKGLNMLSLTTQNLVKKKKIKQAINLIKPNFESSLQDPHLFNKTEIFNTIAEILIENDFYQEAFKFYKEKIFKQKQQHKYLQPYAMATILLHILKRQLPQAEKYNKELINIIPNYQTSNQFEAATNLIKFYNQGNQQLFNKQLTRPVIISLYPLIILKKLRQFKLPIVKNEDKLIKQLLY